MGATNGSKQSASEVAITLRFLAAVLANMDLNYSN